MSATKLEAALDNVRRGFKVFPLAPDTKIPAFKGVNWQDTATRDESVIRQWWKENPEYNIAGRTDHLLVLDMDVHRGGSDAVVALMQTYDLPKTVGSLTHSGGAHFLYALPEGCSVSGGTDKLGIGLDVKSAGGYIVLPGSTIKGKPYAWKNDRAPAPAPQWLIDRCPRTKPKIGIAGKRLVEENAAGVAAAVAWLQNSAPMDVCEGERDDTAFWVCATLYDKGVSFDTARELLTDWSRCACSPPLDDDDISRIASSAGRNRQKPIGIKNPEYTGGFEAVEPANSVQTPNSDKFSFMRADTAADRALVNGTRPLIRGLFDRNTLIIVVGAPGEGKSFIVLDMAYHIGQGLPFAGMKTHQGAVAYVAAEGGEGVFARLAALRAHYGTDLKNLYVLPASVDLLHTPAEAEAIIAAIRKIEVDDGVKVELVIVDTVARALAGGDENSSQDMGAFIKNLDRIRTSVVCAALGVHHTGKDASRGARGHSSLLGAVDTELQVRGKCLTATKQRDMGKEVRIPFDLKIRRIGADSEGEEVTSCYVELRQKGEADDRAPLRNATQIETLRIITELQGKDVERWIHVGEIQKRMPKRSKVSGVGTPLELLAESSVRERMQVLVSAKYVEFGKQNQWRVIQRSPAELSGNAPG